MMSQLKLIITLRKYIHLKSQRAKIIQRVRTQTEALTNLSLE